VEYQKRKTLNDLKLAKAEIENTLALAYTRHISEGLYGTWPALTPLLFPNQVIPYNPLPSPSNEVTTIKVARGLRPEDGEDDGGWIYNRLSGEIRPDSKKYFKLR
jgi:hypothetical protein